MCFSDNVSCLNLWKLLHIQCAIYQWEQSFAFSPCCGKACALFHIVFVAPSSSMRLIRPGLDPQFFDAFSSFFNKPIVVRFSCVQQYNNTYVLHADVVQMNKHTSMYGCDQVQLFVCLGAFLCVWRCYMYFLHSRWGGIYSYSWSRFSTFGDSMLFWFSLLGQTRGRETLLDTLLNCFVFTMLHSVCSIRRKTTGVIGCWTW